MMRHNLCWLGGRLLLWINVEAMVYPGLQKKIKTDNQGPKQGTLKLWKDYFWRIELQSAD